MRGWMITWDRVITAATVAMEARQRRGACARDGAW